MPDSFWDRVVAASKKPPAKKKKTAKPKARPPAPRPGDGELARNLRDVGTKVKGAARPVVRAAKRAESRVDPVIAEMNRLAAPATAKPKVTPEQEDLMRKVRAAYVSRPGSELLGGRLEQISSDADPLINFTEKVTRPFTTPASVTAALIDADPTNAIKQLVSATYWGKQRFPSEALNDRGLLPGGNAGLLLGLGADIAPSFTLPGFKTAGRAAGSQAARAVSREQRLPRSTTERVPFDQQAARLPARPTPRQQRAARLDPRSGPDLITNPNALVVPQRLRPGGEATRGGRPRPAEAAPKPTVDRLPYAPTPKVQRALTEFQQAVAHYEGVTARQPTRLQAARAGQRTGRAESALATAERATVARVRKTPATLTRTQQAQIGARLPGGATKTGVRAPSLIGPRRGPDLPTPKAKPRSQMPPAVKPKDVPYTAIAAAQRGVDEAAEAARALVTASRGPSPESAIRAGEALGRAKAAVKALPVSTTYGMGPRRASTYTRVINAINRVIAVRERAGGRPSPQALVSAGRELEAAVSAHKVAVGGVRAATVAGRRQVRDLGAPSSATPTARQGRAAAPSNGVSVFDDRPRSLSVLRGASHTPMEGRSLPGLRLRVNDARGKMEATVRPAPTQKQIGKAGKRLARAEAKLRKVEKGLRADVEAPVVQRAKPTAPQQEIHRDTFTGSREREWIESNMEYEAAFRAGVGDAPLGINVTLPFRFNKRGVTIPFTSVAAAQKFRAVMSDGPLGEAILAYRQWFVSRYGPNETVRQGAIAADDVVRLESARSARFIHNETKRADLSEDDLILASHWLEGTAKGVVPEKVQAYATRMANFTERNFDTFLQAGGRLKRFGANNLDGGLDRQYVMHLLPRHELDSFSASALARRQMLYGKLPGFMKKREVLTIDSLKRAGFHPVERLDELTFARAMAHHRALAEMELTRQVAQRFGRRTGEAPDEWQAIPSQFTDSDVMVPKDVAQTLRNVIEARLKVPSNKAFAMAQRANQSWKSWALLTAGHDIRNQLGDSALYFQRTMNPVAPLLSLTFGVKTLTGKGKVGSKSRYTSSEAKRLASVSGMRDTGLLGGDVLANVASVEAQSRGAVRRTKITNPLGALHKGVRAGRTYREGVNKAGIFTRELRKGEGAVHASRVAKDTIYDYADVGSVIHWARRSPVGAPFATFTAKNLPAQIRMAAQQPGQLSAALTGIESLRKQTGGWPRFLVPAWMRERVPIPIPGYGTTNLDLPINSLNLIPTGSLGGGGSFLGTVTAWQSQLGPLLQTPIAAKGIDPLTGEKFRGQRPASRTEQFLQMFPVTAYFLGGADMTMTRDQSGRKIAVPAAKDDFMSWVFRAFTPGLSTAGRLSGSEGRSTMDSVRSPLLGHTKRNFFDRAQVESMQRGLAFEYREKVGDFNRRLQANAPNWRKGDPIPKHLQGDYQNIVRIIAQGEWIAEALRAAGR